MRGTIPTMAVMALAVASCAEPPPADPVPRVPIAQQRAIGRLDLGSAWPLTVDGGALACADEAVMFRAAGTTYALNDRARAAGLPAIDALVDTRRGGPPSNPLGRLRQGERQRIFAELMTCDAGDGTAASETVVDCRGRVAETSRVTGAELDQIEAEGRERVWAPLPPMPKDPTPLVTAGLALCPR